MHETNEERDGLRSIRVITRNIPIINLETALQSFGYVIEYSNGLMFITKPE